jgi:hypothetical protein
MFYLQDREKARSRIDTYEYHSYCEEGFFLWIAIYIYSYSGNSKDDIPLIE